MNPHSITTNCCWWVEQRKIIADGFAEFLKPACFLVGMDLTDRNGRHQSAKHRKLARAHLSVEDSIGVSVGHQRKKSTLRPHSFQVGRRIRTALAQNINGPEWKRAAFEQSPLVPKVEAPLIPIRDESGKRLRRTIEHFHRIGPKRKVGIGWHDVKRALSLYERGNVVRKNSITVSREGCCSCRFSCPYRADEGYTVIFESHGAGMQTGNTTQPQQKSEDRPQKIGSRVFERRRPRPYRPECFSFAIQPKLRAIGVGDAQKCSLRYLPNPQTRFASFSAIRAHVRQLFLSRQVPSLGIRRTPQTEFDIRGTCR